MRGTRMHKLTIGVLIGLMVMTISGCFVEGPAVPYSYSPAYCVGCWYGVWEGREGWHEGGGRPWEREHHEGDHRGEGHRGEGERHEGHH
jgi:hypothetical protein